MFELSHREHQIKCEHLFNNSNYSSNKIVVLILIICVEFITTIKYKTLYMYIMPEVIFQHYHHNE